LLSERDSKSFLAARAFNLPQKTSRQTQWDKTHRNWHWCVRERERESDRVYQRQSKFLHWGKKFLFMSWHQQNEKIEGKKAHEADWEQERGKDEKNFEERALYDFSLTTHYYAMTKQTKERGFMEGTRRKIRISFFVWESKRMFEKDPRGASACLHTHPIHHACTQALFVRHSQADEYSVILERFVTCIDHSFQAYFGTQ
jgi:hypothetical protein